MMNNANNDNNEIINKSTQKRNIEGKVILSIVYIFVGLFALMMRMKSVAILMLTCMLIL